MANPQVENGFTRIANELLEAITAANLSAREFRVVLVVIRRSYGFNAKEAVITLSEFAESTGLHRAHVPSVIRSLERKKILLRQAAGRIITYSVQKDYTQWDSQIGTTQDGTETVKTTTAKDIAKSVPPDGTETVMTMPDNDIAKSVPPPQVSQIGTTPGTKSVPPLNQIGTTHVLGSKDTLKDREKDNVPPLPPRGADAMNVIAYLNAKAGKKFGNGKMATKEIERAMRCDQATVADCLLVIDFCWATWSQEFINDYLGPVSPFRAKNFSGNLTRAREWDATGRKPRYGNGGSGQPLPAKQLEVDYSKFSTPIENWKPKEKPNDQPSPKPV